MMEICKKEHCTGCAACMNKCPKQCIEMKEDEFGYLFPFIDESHCIECGLCQKVCPENNRPSAIPIQKAYAAWSLDDYDRGSSTSGGIASVLTNHILHQGGVAFGAVSSEKCDVRHEAVEQVCNAARFKGSKYVQSTIGYCYQEVKEALKQNKQVLFTGTPCQVAGLRNFLGKPYENLYTVDIICHGVPSLKLLSEHLSRYCLLDDITKVSFRNNEGYVLSAYKDDKLQYSKPFPNDRYLYGFMYALFYRPSCYECRYANSHRISDLTIGDFWGLGKKRPVNYDTKKVSVVTPNTDKGALLLKACKQKLFLEERDREEAISGNKQLQVPSIRHKYYQVFRALYHNFGFSCAIKVCMIEFYIKYFVYKRTQSIKKLF